MLLPEPATIEEGIRGSQDGQRRANVFRESKAVNLLISTPERSCLEKTKTQFSCDGYHMLCCGSLRDPAGRAICEGFLVNDYLKGCARLGVRASQH
jgi:hypothetical protein